MNDQGVKQVSIKFKCSDNSIEIKSIENINLHAFNYVFYELEHTPFYDLFSISSFFKIIEGSTFESSHFIEYTIVDNVRFGYTISFCEEDQGFLVGADANFQRKQYIKEIAEGVARKIAKEVLKIQ